MARNTPTDSTGAKPVPREDRLKAALKANLARRKAQNRARSQNAVERNENPARTGQDKDA